jgi:hypothetical protein
MISLEHRRQHDGTISAQIATRQEWDFLVHLEAEYLVAVVNTARLVEARALVKRHSLRTLDAIQLACAVDTARVLGESLTFVSADRRLLAAAAAEGFSVDDPTAHP